jgi:hypothetical protein
MRPDRRLLNPVRPCCVMTVGIPCFKPRASATGMPEPATPGYRTMNWKRWSGYHRRSLIETKMHGFELLGERVASRTSIVGSPGLRSMPQSSIASRNSGPRTPPALHGNRRQRHSHTALWLCSEAHRLAHTSPISSGSKGSGNSGAVQSARITCFPHGPDRGLSSMMAPGGARPTIGRPLPPPARCRMDAPAWPYTEPVR